MKIFIPKDMLENHVNNYELLAYCYIKALTPLKEIEKYHINMNSLLYAVYEKEISSQNIRENFYKAIDKLFECGLISGERCGKGNYIIETAPMFVDTQNQHFVVVELKDIQTIIRSNSVVRVPLVSYFIYLMSTISAKTTVYNVAGIPKNNVVGNQTQDYLAYIMRSSVPTVRRYNKLLEDMKVIYIHRANDFILTDDGLRQLNNVYGRYDDREYIDRYAESLKEQLHSYNHLKPRLDEANNKRRLSKMYYWLCRDKEYSESEIREIYEYVTSENEMYRNLAESEHDKRYVEKLKDETIFRQYPFLFQREE